MPSWLDKNKINDSKTWLINILFGALVFLAPTNFFYVISENYVVGLRVDYLLTRIFATQLILWPLGLYFGWGKRKELSKHWQIFGLFLLLTMRQFFTPNPWVGLSGVMNLLTAGLVGWQLTSNKKLINEFTFMVASVSAILFQSGLAIYQFVMQKSLAGYWLLGEPNLSLGNVAKTTLLGREMFLPYGSTAHPNILGGFLAIYLVWLGSIKWSKNKWGRGLIWLSVGLGVATIILSQSLTAIATLFLGIIYLAINKWRPKWLQRQNVFMIFTAAVVLGTPVVLNVANNLVHHESIQRRVALNKIAKAEFLANPVVGLGVGQFTTSPKLIAYNQEIVRFLQPVHHILLLWLSETGLLGLALAMAVGWQLREKKIFWARLAVLAVALSLDHWLGSGVGGMAMILLFSFVDFKI